MQEKIAGASYTMTSWYWGMNNVRWTGLTGFFGQLLNNRTAMFLQIVTHSPSGSPARMAWLHYKQPAVGLIEKNP